MLTVNQQLDKVDIYCIPEELTQLNQWVGWNAEPSDEINENGEQVLNKVPVTPQLNNASSTDEATWRRFEQIERAYEQERIDGIGFVFTKNDDIVGLDLDNHFDEEVPLTDIAKEILELTYVELSPSRTGAHAYFKGKLPNAVAHKFKEDGKELEIYDKERFFTVTGLSIGQDEILDDQSYIDELVEKYFKKEVVEREEVTSNSKLDIDTVREFILKNDKAKALFKDGDLSNYQHDESRADMALCNHLAFYSGRDAYIMDKLFRESALYRDKWDSKRGNSTYGEYTINKVIDTCKDVYKHSVDDVEEDIDVWDEVVDYEELEVPPFPKGVFPEWIEDYIDAVSISTQTPRDMACQGAIAALSTVLAKKVYINVAGDWIEPCNTYTLTLMPPGSRKSAVFKHMMEPINEQEVKDTESSKYAVQMREAEIEVLEKRVEEAKKKLSRKPDDRSNKEALSESIKALEDTKPLSPPKYTIDDATPEVVGKLLQENNERLSIVSAEGGIMQQIGGRYSTVSNMEIYLKGHAGDSQKVNRIGRSSVYLDEPLLTVGVFGQPSIIRDLPREFYDKGIMARFLYSMPLDNVGHRLVRPPSINKAVKERYKMYMQELMALNLEKTLIKPNMQADIEIRNFQEAFEKRFTKGQLFDGTEELRDWANKYVGALMRIASLIHASEWIEQEGRIHEFIRPETVKASLKLDEYYIAHTKKAFDISQEDTIVEKSKFVLEKILEIEPQDEIIKRSDIWIKVRSKFSKSKELDYVLEELEERNFIKYHNKSITKGARSTKFIRINPIF